MSTWLVPRNRWLCGQRTSCCAKVENVDSVVLRRKTQQRWKTEETEEYLGTMDCHTESVKKCVNCILSYLVMFILKNTKLIKDEMMAYFYRNTSSKLITTRSPQAFLWASNLPLFPLFGGGGGIQINIFVWYAKRDPYNMLIGVLIDSSSTPHALLNDCPITPQRPYITKRIKVILDFPAFFSWTR